jgi:hypothetical protein
VFFFPNLFNATGHTTIVGVGTIVLFLGMKADKDFPKIIRNMELSTFDSKNKSKILNKNRLKGKLLPTFC